MCFKRNLLCTLLPLAWAVSTHAQPGIWFPPVNLSNSNYGSGYPSIAAGDDNSLHIVYEDNTRLGGGYDECDIIYTSSNGDNWSAPFQISAYDVTASKSPRVAIDSLGIPHVVWTHQAFNTPEIYYACQQETGWAEPVNLSQNSVPSIGADIAIDSENHIHVFWSDGYYGTLDILHRVYNGSQWEPIDTVYQGGYSCDELRIAIDLLDHIHVTWRDLGNFGAFSEIGYTEFNGISWSEPENVSCCPDRWSEEPDIALDSNGVPYIVWRQVMPIWPAEEIFCSHYNNGTWSPPESITNLGMESGYPHLAITSEDVLHLLFMVADQLGNEYVNSMYCQDGIWSEPDTVIVGPTSIGSELAIGSGNVVHAAISPMLWIGNSEIFYTYTTAGTYSLLANLSPESTSITIPTGGGSFVFDIQISNIQVVPVTFDIWIDAVLPGGTVYGPLLFRDDITLSAESTVLRSNLLQTVPGGAPMGTYYYRLQLGAYNDNIVVSADSFAFYKEGIDVTITENWSLPTWDKKSDLNPFESQSRISTLDVDCYPSPANSAVTISYLIEVNTPASLQVFDVTGSLITTLVDGLLTPGLHQAVWNADNSAAGVYFYRLKTDLRTVSGHFVILK